MYTLFVEENSSFGFLKSVNNSIQSIQTDENGEPGRVIDIKFSTYFSPESNTTYYCALILYTYADLPRHVESD